MFGWIKKRERFENIKLVTQNKMAAAYFREQAEIAQDSGLGGDPLLIGMIDEALDEILEATFGLRHGQALKQDVFKAQITLNKNFRVMYDEFMAGKMAFAKTFGSVSERIEKFDQKFQPNEGWKIFVEHFR